MTYEIKALIAAALLTLAFFGGCSVQGNMDAEELAQMETKLAKKDADIATAKQKAAEALAENTRKAEEKLEAQRVKSLKEQEDAKKNFDATVANLRAGNIVVREKFTCPANPTSGIPGESAGGLSTEDAEFLLRESERADELARRYNNLIEFLDLIYESQK
jgi:multidrug efflux pump subunit AcrA (membrane-fusion protein)